MHRKLTPLFGLFALCTTLPALGQGVVREMYQWSPKSTSETMSIPENAYLILYITVGEGKVSSGVLNSTTDEYDSPREGYHCGYSVLPLQNIRDHGDTIRFTVRAESEHDLFDMPIPPGLESIQYARAQKYPKWSAEHHHTMPFPEVEYTAVRLPDGNLSVSQRSGEPRSEERTFLYAPTPFGRPKGSAHTGHTGKGAQASQAAKKYVKETPPIFSAEGFREVHKYIEKHLVYPEKVADRGIGGRTMVSLCVEADGLVTEVQIAQSSGNMELDKAAWELVRKMPRWIPATVDGKPVRTYVCIPIIYSIEAYRESRYGRPSQGDQNDSSRF